MEPILLIQSSHDLSKTRTNSIACPKGIVIVVDARLRRSLPESTSEESLRKSTHRECGDDVLPLWSSKQKLQPYFTGVNQDESNVKPRNQAVGSSRMRGSNRQRFRLRMRSPSKAKSNTGSSAASSMLSNHICSLIGVFRYKPFCYFSRSVSTPVQSGETPFTM